MKIELKGYNIDKLLSSLHKKKFNLKNIIRYEYNNVSFEINEKDEKRIKKYIANFKTKLEDKKRKKLNSFFLFHLDMILGSFFGILICLFLSNFTWDIKVFGTKDLDVYEIVEVLKENGVRTQKINTLSNEQIEEILLDKYDRIAQVSVMKMGTSIVINLSEKLVFKVTDFAPIIAKFAGIIESINLITGTLNCKVGDYVNVGDLLVLPFNLSEFGEKINVKPIAEINAKIFIVGKAEMKKNETILVRSGNEIVTYNYKFKNHNLFSGKNKNSFAIFESIVYNENVSDLIPLWREKVVFYELVTHKKENNLEENREILLQKSYDSALKQLDGKMIVDETKSVEIFEDKMIATTILTTQGLINDCI